MYTFALLQQCAVALDIIRLFHIEPWKLELFLAVLMGWSLIWKGLALWRAGSNREKVWFTALFLIQTFGLLEIFYLYYKRPEQKPL